MLEILSGLLMGAVIYAWGFWYGQKRGREAFIEAHPVNERVKMAIPPMPRGPFAKPKENGKRTPKVNDDIAAWAKENES